ncbi:MAG TPA: DNA methyltransferase [Vicinamibacterales bacterium]|nr:DNA methyltransferase [Vicinamibacterales bacterium]
MTRAASQSPANRLRQGYGGPPKLSAKAEAGHYVPNAIPTRPTAVLQELRAFTWNGRTTAKAITSVGLSKRPIVVETLVNEFWTSKQRAASSLHEVSYRACFKPQLPRFFIERFTAPGDIVYDPFMGRGTTVVEAALLGRTPAGCDINPLSAMLAAPRLSPPTLEAVVARLEDIDLSMACSIPGELRVFYHEETLREICALREYLMARERRDSLDAVDRWIRMVAVNRLTGHSPGFFSVYSMPPNQAVSVDAQAKINANRKQVPPRRNVRALIAAKTKSLLSDVDSTARAALLRSSQRAQLMTGLSHNTPRLARGSVSLIVTSPPFLDVVNYAADNWLRCWFCGIDAAGVQISMHKKVDDWQAGMTAVFGELARVLKRGGHVAFEVGEVRGGRIKLEEAVLPCGVAAGLQPLMIVINSQEFTKTANCWGVKNNSKGTNTNRIVVFRK